MSSIADQFLSRLPPHAPAGFRDDISAAFGIAQRFAERAAAIKNDKKLTAEGRRAAAQDALRGLSGHMTQIRANVMRVRERIASNRAALKPKALDPTDTFGEMRRAEVRTWLRSLPFGERIQHLNTDDPLIRQAIVTAPPALSGIPADRHAVMIEADMEHEHGTRIRELKELEEMVANVDAALQVAAMHMQRDSGLLDHEFTAVAFEKAA